jgi:hypothetical protein
MLHFQLSPYTQLRLSSVYPDLETFHDLLIIGEGEVVGVVWSGGIAPRIL